MKNTNIEDDDTFMDYEITVIMMQKWKTGFKSDNTDTETNYVDDVETENI